MNNQNAWWQGLITAVVGAVATALLHRYLGPEAAAAGAGALATGALMKQSPLGK